MDAVDIKDMEVGATVGICPNCNHELVIRKGKYGNFIGCKNYPNCKKTYQLKGFKIREENIELAKVTNARSVKTVLQIMNDTQSEKIRDLANQKLIEYHYCTCGRKTDCTRIYRTTKDFPHYLKEHYCKECGYFITTETPTWKSFTRMGKIDDNGDDSETTGGYWL